MIASLRGEQSEQLRLATHQRDHGLGVQMTCTLCNPPTPSHFVHPPGKYLLNIYQVPGTVVGADTGQRTEDQSPALMELTY